MQFIIISFSYCLIVCISLYVSNSYCRVCFPVFEEEEEEEDDDEEEVEEESQVASRQGSQEKVNEDGEENLPQDDHVSVDVPFSQEENISQNPDGPPENNEDDGRTKHF